MANDIRLTVAGDTRRMTYAELADVRGISPASAKRLTQRHRWGRQVGNDGVVRVTVPLSALINPPKPKANADASDTKTMSSVTGATPPVTSSSVADDVTDDAAPDVIPATAALVEAIEVLRNQLEVANRRADRAEAQAEHERNRADRAEQRASETIAYLRSEITALLQLLINRRPWWCKWFR